MACRGCKKRAKEFRRKIMKEKAKEVQVEKAVQEDHKVISARKEKEHWMKICTHGSPHGRFCKICDKVISIPEDAKIKPEGWEIVPDKD